MVVKEKFTFLREIHKNYQTFIRSMKENDTFGGYFVFIQVVSSKNTEPSGHFHTFYLSRCLDVKRLGLIV